MNHHQALDRSAAVRPRRSKDLLCSKAPQALGHWPTRCPWVQTCGWRKLPNPSQRPRRGKPAQRWLTRHPGMCWGPDKPASTARLPAKVPIPSHSFPPGPVPSAPDSLQAPQSQGRSWAHTAAQHAGEAPGQVQLHSWAQDFPFQPFLSPPGVEQKVRATG